MPILLSVNDLEPGMRLAGNLVNRYSVLLPHGRQLTEMDITALRRKFPDMNVPVLDPVLDHVVEFDNTQQEQEVSLKVRRGVAGVVGKVSSQIRAGVSLDSKTVSGIQNVIDDMINFLRDNPVTMALVEQSRSWDNYLQEHSANVFYLALLIGNTLRNYIKQERERLSAAKTIAHGMDITPLATAALFHDLGMVPLEPLFHKTDPLSMEEVLKIREHPAVGAAALPDNIDPMVKLVIRQHHENHAGTGYPEGLTGDQINIFARIIRVADAYTAAICTRIYRKGKSPVRTLFEMLHGPYRDFYDPIVLKVLASIMQPFPIGGKIKLENGCTAVVARYNRRDPFRPEMITAFDAFGDPVPEDALQPVYILGESPDHNPAFYDGEDIRYIIQATAQTPLTPAELAALQSTAEVFDLVFP